jgi:hypothetical protein
MNHKCFAKNCNRQVPSHLLMCLAHWRMVSPPTQRAVYDAYQTGQTLETATSAWFEAAKKARAEVEANEAPAPVDDRQQSLFGHDGGASDD